MLVTTTQILDGIRITEYLGLVSGQAVVGANFFRDFFAGIRDVIGGRSGGYEHVFEQARTAAVADMIGAAERAGATATAIVGAEIEVLAVGKHGTILVATAVGTAVLTERRERE